MAQKKKPNSTRSTTRNSFLKDVQRHIANVAIGASTARRMGPPGTIAAVRSFLASMSLTDFAKPGRFAAKLSRYTYLLNRHLKKERLGSGSWGASRKFLNIFLRDTCYNVYLREAYGLARLDRLLELPLDSQVAKGLRKDCRDLGLPKLPGWRGVIHMTPGNSKQYQIAAAKVAASGGRARVHLDLKYWRAL